MLINLLILIIALLFSFYFKIYFLAAIVFWILVSISAPFFDVPSMIKSGRLHYYSIFLLAEQERNQQIVMHGGTLFDYYFNLNRAASSKERKLFIIREYLNGILELVRQYRHRPAITIKATTHILNERTARKLGFKPVKPDTIQKILLILNYPNLVVSQSIVNGRLSFPNLKSIKTYMTDSVILKENQEDITSIRSGLL